MGATTRTDAASTHRPQKQKSPAIAGLFESHCESRAYALNDFPHPQLPPVAFGFVTENPAPRKSST